MGGASQGRLGMLDGREREFNCLRADRTQSRLACSSRQMPHAWREPAHAPSAATSA